MREPARAPRRLSLVTLAVVSVLPTLLLLIVGEAGARLYHAWRHPVGRSIPCSRTVVRHDTNSLGLRGPEWPGTKQAGTVRVLVAGASTTYGLYNSYETAWPNGTLLGVAQANVLIEAVRRDAAALGVPAIDPRVALAAPGERGGFFCDQVHLTDEGNAVLAEAVADRLRALVRD